MLKEGEELGSVPHHKHTVISAEEEKLRCASRKVAQSLTSIIMSSNDLLKSKIEDRHAFLRPIVYYPVLTFVSTDNVWTFTPW